jgi:hypothetical protein
MATTILLLLIILLTIASIPWLENMNDYKTHRTDSMAGDEGED